MKLCKSIINNCRDYITIFLYTCIIFITFSNEITFGAVECKYAKDGNPNYDWCLNNDTDVDEYWDMGAKESYAQSYTIDHSSMAGLKSRYDVDGNIAVNCLPAKPKSGKANPFASDDYYYVSNNKSCLIFAISIAITHAALQTSASKMCKPTGTISYCDGGSCDMVIGNDPMSDISTLRKALNILTSTGKIVASTAGGIAITAFTDPVKLATVTAVSEAVVHGVNFGLIIKEIATSYGTNPKANAAVPFCVIGVTMPALLQAEIQPWAAKLYRDMKRGLKDIAVCGNDWNTYAFTSRDSKNPVFEWYPEYGPFSNSYEYKINKLMSGEYSCNKFYSKEYKNTELSEPIKKDDAKKCDNSCKVSLQNCWAQNRDSTNSADVQYCIENPPSSCDSYCAEYFTTCEPIEESILEDGEGICSYDCDDVTANSKTIRNRVFRERNYNGKEYVISSDYIEDKSCYDPRLDSVKGYTGKEQRYYLRGYSEGQYACSRFVYNNDGCIIYDGKKKTIYTQQEAAENSDVAAKCRQAFSEAETCCRNRAARAICLYKREYRETNDSDNKKITTFFGDRGKAVMCLKGIGENDGTQCNISGHKFVAREGEFNSTDICAREDDNCPYMFNVAGGTPYAQSYCDGNTEDSSCPYHWRIWKKPIERENGEIANRNTPTNAYGEIQNFCYYNSHCTQIGDDMMKTDYMISNKFLPPVCSNFIGDSQNLPSSAFNVNLGFSSFVIKALKKYVNRKDFDDPSITPEQQSKNYYDFLNKIERGVLTESQLKEIVLKFKADTVINLLLVIFAEKVAMSVLAGRGLAIAQGSTINTTDTPSNVMSLLMSGEDFVKFQSVYKLVYLIKGNTKNRDEVKSQWDIVGTEIKTMLSKMLYELYKQEPIANDMSFSLGTYRGLTAPMAQCIKETLYNMFNNVAGISSCKNNKEQVNSEGLCGEDTFGPPAVIRNYLYDEKYFGSNDAYNFIIGGPLPVEDNIFLKLQRIMNNIVKLFFTIALVVWALDFMLGGKLDLFEDSKQVKVLTQNLVKFALVIYFSLGNAWQSMFYNWLDKSIMYLYGKSFELSLVGYQGYKSPESTYSCVVSTQTTKIEPLKRESKICDIINYSKSEINYNIPTKRSSNTIEIIAFGAKGGEGSKSKGGDGARVYAKIENIDSDLLTINVGGAGFTGRNGYNSNLGNIGLTCGGAGGNTVITKAGETILLVSGGNGGHCTEPIDGQNASDNFILFSHAYDNLLLDNIGSNLNNVGGSNFINSALFNSYFYINEHNLQPVINALYYDELNNYLDNNNEEEISKLVDKFKSITNDGNGRVYICYNTNIDTYRTIVDEKTIETENNLPLDSLPLGIKTAEIGEKCLVDTSYDSKTDITTKISKCYSSCSENYKFDANNELQYKYSERYDGCYFGDTSYPEGKKYLAIFDSLDCKLQNILNYGPSTDLPGIIHFIFVSLFFAPLGMIIAIFGSIFFIILLLISLKILYIFLMSLIAINIMIFVSPIIFPMVMTKQTKSMFDGWLKNFLSFCLQFIFVCVYTGFLIGAFEKFTIGSATYANHDPTTGRFPKLICGSKSSDSLVCIFKINTTKGTKPLFGEKIYKFLGIGPVVSVVESLIQDFPGTLNTIIRAVIVMLVLLMFLDKMPDIAASLTGGVALNGVSIGKIKDIVAHVGNKADMLRNVARSLVPKVNLRKEKKKEEEKRSELKIPNDSTKVVAKSPDPKPGPPPEVKTDNLKDDGASKQEKPEPLKDKEPKEEEKTDGGTKEPENDNTYPTVPDNIPERGGGSEVGQVSKYFDGDDIWINHVDRDDKDPLKRAFAGEFTEDWQAKKDEKAFGQAFGYFDDELSMNYSENKEREAFNSGFNFTEDDMKTDYSDRKERERAQKEESEFMNSFNYGKKRRKRNRKKKKNKGDSSQGNNSNSNESNSGSEGGE